MTPRQLKPLLIAVGGVLAALALGALLTTRRAPRAGLGDAGPLPEFELAGVTAESHGPFSSRDMRGRPWVADFIFTSCTGPCPLLSAEMARLQERLPKQVGLVSFTVDPGRDIPEVLKAYARRFRADPARWRFVTGEKAGIARLLREGFKIAAVEDPGAPSGLRVTHSTKFVLVDASGVLRGYYDGLDAGEIARLEADARRLAR